MFNYVLLPQVLLDLLPTPYLPNFKFFLKKQMKTKYNKLPQNQEDKIKPHPKRKKQKQHVDQWNMTEDLEINSHSCCLLIFNKGVKGTLGKGHIQ